MPKKPNQYKKVERENPRSILVQNHHFQINTHFVIFLNQSIGHSLSYHFNAHKPIQHYIPIPHYLYLSIYLLFAFTISFFSAAFYRTYYHKILKIPKSEKRREKYNFNSWQRLETTALLFVRVFVLSLLIKDHHILNNTFSIIFVTVVFAFLFFCFFSTINS